MFTSIRKALVPVWLYAAMVFWTVGLLPAAHAATGLDYLTTQQNPDGSFGNTPTSLATPVQSTAEVLRAFQTLGETAQPGFGPALTFLNNDTENNTEFLARKIVVNGQAGNDVSLLLSELLTHQNFDGGFGDFSGFDSSVLDTTFALEALSIVGVAPGAEIAGAVGFLLNQQQADGGWADGANDSSVYLTALAMRALEPYRSVFVGVSDALNNAQAFLLAQRDTSGLWAETFETALALTALIPDGADVALIEASVQGLGNTQNTNGSWEDDTYTTALALQALFLAENRPASPTLSNIQGIVIDALTALPLNGVTVNLTGPTPSSLVTAADGVFVFRDVQPGPYSVDLTLADYAPVTATTTAAAGNTVDFGTIPLTRAGGATTGIVSGTVTDSSTGSALSGVSVSVTGVTNPATTANDGTYLITGVPRGAVTLQATLDGFSTGTATANVVAGGQVIFSPALTPVTAPTTAIQGTVTNADTGAPLAGATISLTGATTASTTTDAQGDYSIEGLNPGQTVVTVSLTNFQSATASTAVFANSIIIFSPGLFPVGSPGGNTTGVTGVVVDAGNSQPLAGVSVQAGFGASTPTTTTGADGRFSITGLTELQGTLTFTLADYTTSTLSVTLQPLTVFDVGQVRLRRVGVTELLPDLIVQAVDAQGTTSDPNTLELTGNLTAEIANQGTANTAGTVDVLAFYDSNKNGQFDDGTDPLLGQTTVTTPDLAASENVQITVAGTLPFRDAPISVFVDSAQIVVESNEDNNVDTSASACIAQPDIGTFEPVLKWEWTGSTVEPRFNQVMMAPAVAQTNDDNGDGQIDRNDIPDVIFVAFGGAGGDFGAGILRIVSGADGQELVAVTDNTFRLTSFGNIAVGDIDADGLIEIVGPKFGGGLIAFENDGTRKWSIDLPTGWNIGGPSIADIDGDGSPEIVLGNRVVSNTGTIRWTGTGGFSIGGSHPNGSLSIVANIDNVGSPEVIVGASVYDSSGQLRWVNSAVGDGFTAVGNFDADATAEIVVVGNGRVHLLDHDGSIVWGPVALPGGGRGGPPTVADVDVMVNRKLESPGPAAIQYLRQTDLLTGVLQREIFRRMPPDRQCLTLIAMVKQKLFTPTNLI